MRTIANLGIVPSWFNINEPVLFGLPIVLNPMLLIPFILIPLVLTVISYFAIYTGLVPRTIALLPWTTPPIMGGFVATGSIRGALLCIFNLIVGIAMYIPFIIASEKIEKQYEVGANQNISQN